MGRIAMGWACALVFAAPAAFGSDAATSAYLAARDKAIEAYKNVSAWNDALDQRMQRDLAQLQLKLRPLVGPVQLKGFSPNGTYTLETLAPEVGFGALDGLAFKSTDGKTTAVVTSLPLLQDWLAEQTVDPTTTVTAPTTDPATAFGSNDFYSSAFADDTYYYRYAELPVTHAAGVGPVSAWLYVAAQDDPAPSPPDGLVVSVVNGTRVLLLRTSVTAPDIAPCTAAYQQYVKKAEASWAAYQARKHAHDDKTDPYVDQGDQANSAFLTCYAQHLPDMPAYAALVHQAQALVDLASGPTADNAKGKSP